MYAETLSAGLNIPNNSLNFVQNLSSALAKSAPHLTLELLKEWTIGFNRGDLAQKTAGLHYVGPWILNLELFAKPSRDEGMQAVKQVEEIVRALISATVSERRVSLGRCGSSYIC
jgi:neurofibromin 1